MANVRINNLPPVGTMSPTMNMAVDSAATQKATIQQVVDTGAPVASQAEAEAGTDNSKRMTPLTTKRAISAQGAGLFATTAQGAKADTAVQPAQLDAVKVPAGGTTGQVLAKTSNADNAVGWSNAGAGDMLSVVYDPDDFSVSPFGGGLPASTVAAASALSPVAAPEYIRTSGYSADGDGGAALYRKVASEPSHAGKFSVTLSDGLTVVWYEIVAQPVPAFAAFGSKSDGTTDDHDALENQLQFAKFGVLPRGSTVVAEPLVIDNSTMSGETETGPQGTVLRGQDARQSLLVASAANVGPVAYLKYGVGVAAHARHKHGDFSIVGTGQDGLHVENAAFLRMENISVRGCATALILESTLSSSFRDIACDYNSFGMVLRKGGGFSFPNALQFDNCNFGSNSQLAVSGGDPVHNVTWRGGTVEGNGTQGDSNTGGVFLNLNGGAEGSVAANFQGVYFEGNGGQADIRLENTGSQYVVVNIEDCNFNRASAAKFTDTNIVAVGKIILRVVGCGFRGFNDYVESAARPYIRTLSGAILLQEGNHFNDPVAAPGIQSHCNLGRYRGVVNTAATGGKFPSGWTVSHSAAGVTDVTHNLGVAVEDYSVSAMATDDARTVQRLSKTPNSFSVVTTDLAGALTNSAIDFTVMVG